MTRIKQLLPTYDRHYLIGLFVNKYKIQVETDCWLWQGNKNAKGYEQLRIPTGHRNRLSIKIHRLIAFLYLDFDLDPNKQVCHKCNNESCINPEHLYVGNNSTNQLDSIALGKKSIYKTREYCSKGHEYTVENTRYYKDMKLCRTCINYHAMVSRVKKRANQCKNPSSVQE